MEYTHCMNCRRPKHGTQRDTKFCSPQCKIWYEADKDYETQKALEAFRKEGEPNKGGVR